MSKNIVIQEGGVGRQMTASKLKTDLVGGGTCLWVPEDETQLITKSITKNGTYKASSDGAYGYSKVIVNVAGGSVSGKGSDGNTHNYSTDDQGNIVDEVIPDTIAVTTPPTNPYGIYQNGQTITTEGMVVKAYNGDGTEYGTVPLDEITISPTTAVYDESTDSGTTASSDLLPYSVSLSTEMEGEYRDGTSSVIIRRSASPGSTLFTIQESDGARRCTVVKCSNENVFSGGSSYIYDGKTVYYYAEMFLDYLYNVYPNPIRAEISNMERDKVAWTAIYGDISRAGSHQTINVSWPRPGDGAELTTTFEILVAPGYTPGDSNEL